MYRSLHRSMYLSIYVSIYLSIYLSIYRSIVVVVVVVVVVAVVVEVRVVKLVELLKLVKLVKLISVYFFDISTSKKAQNPQFFTLLTSKCASRHNRVHFFDTFSTSEPPKVVRDRQFLTLLTWKCASRHNGVHFFNISTSKSDPELRCFVHFDLEMCFAPQRRALFQHLNFQKWSGAEVFCTFWLGNVLRATTACTFLTSILPKVLRPWCVLYILTWKSASRHNGVQFFISRLASWLSTRRFSEPTFRPSGATNHWKNTVFRDFPTFSRICSVCPLTLSLLIFSLLIFLFSVPLPCSAFHLSILSEVWLLNFLRLLLLLLLFLLLLTNMNSMDFYLVPVWEGTTGITPYWRFLRHRPPPHLHGGVSPAALTLKHQSTIASVQHRQQISTIIWSYGSVSKPCTPGEHQNSW